LINQNFGANTNLHTQKSEKLFSLNVSFILYCWQINIAEDVGEITKVRVGFVDPSKMQQWHLLKVGDKILLIIYICKYYFIIFFEDTEVQ